MENFEVKSGKIYHENTNRKIDKTILTLDKIGKRTMMYYCFTNKGFDLHLILEKSGYSWNFNTYKPICT